MASRILLLIALIAIGVSGSQHDRSKSKRKSRPLRDGAVLIPVGLIAIMLTLASNISADSGGEVSGSFQVSEQPTAIPTPAFMPNVDPTPTYPPRPRTRQSTGHLPDVDLTATYPPQANARQSTLYLPFVSRNSPAPMVTSAEERHTIRVTNTPIPAQDIPVTSTVSQAPRNALLLRPDLRWPIPGDPAAESRHTASVWIVAGVVLAGLMARGIRGK